MKEKEKLKINIPVVVEGKYDKIRLSNIIDANIVTTEGFGIFNDTEKQSLLRRLSEKGIIVLCDSDRAGGFIRSVLSGYLPKDKIYNLYTPSVVGKERRKAEASKDGLLGVEGIDDKTLYDMFASFLASHSEAEGYKRGKEVTKADFYEYGLTGHDDSKEKRNRLCDKIGLPNNMTSTALLSAVNTLYTAEEFKKIADLC